jgi:hypothetical protein
MTKWTVLMKLHRHWKTTKEMKNYITIATKLGVVVRTPFSGNIVALGLYQAIIMLGWLNSQPIAQGLSSNVNYEVVVLAGYFSWKTL